MTGCACGHHHHAPARIEGGEGIALDRPLVALSGTLMISKTLRIPKL